MSAPGSNIRTLRLQMGLSLRALAKAADMDHGNLSKLEAGKIGFSEEVIATLARILCVSPSVLFADPEKLESASLRARPLPVLSMPELANWRGPDDAEYGEEQEFLYVGLKRASRYSFALRIPDAANSPAFVEGDEVIFDPRVTPKSGDWVSVQDADNSIHVGRIRITSAREFEVIPVNFEKHPIVSSATSRQSWLRGTAVEFRRQLT